MKKDIWLKPGKELNTGAIIGGIGFAIYIALSALEWRGLALFAALAFGLEAGYAFLSALDCREKDKDSVSYNIVWGTGALAILMLLPAVTDDHQRVTCAWSKAGKRNRKRRGWVCLSALFFYLTNTPWGYMMQTK